MLLEHFINIENFGMTLEDRDKLIGMRAVLTKEKPRTRRLLPAVD